MVKVMVAGFINYIDQTHNLVKKLCSVGVPANDIYVVVTGNTQEKIEFNNDVVYHYVTHNSFEYSVLIEVIEQNIEEEYIFLIHDTCDVGDNFYSKLIRRIPMKYDYYPACDEHWFNIGIYKTQALKNIGNYLVRLKNCNKQKGLIAEKVIPTLFRTPTTQKTVDLGVKDEIQTFYLPEFEIYKKQRHYQNSTTLLSVINSNPSMSKVITPKPEFQNVFACLVHEKIDVVLDMVKNLTYFDPHSKIILYNGGHDMKLLKNFDLKQYPNVYIHPKSQPQSYGRLHDFMIDCMLFANDNFNYDTITNCDSDQLLLQKGYSNLMSKIQNPKVGIWISPNGSHKFPAFVKDSNEYMEPYPIRTFHDEIAIWEPIVEKYKIPIKTHQFWTFNPGTVITKKGADAILQACKDPLYAQAINDSKIFATEEIFFNLMCLGANLECKRNPISFDYIKFRMEFNIENIKIGPMDYWVHPVERDMQNPIRQWIRTNNNNYI